MGIYYLHTFSSAFSHENIKNNNEKFVVINNFEVGGKKSFDQIFLRFSTTMLLHCCLLILAE